MCTNGKWGRTKLKIVPSQQDVILRITLSNFNKRDIILKNYLSNATKHQNHPKDLLKVKLLGPIPRVSTLVSLGWGWGAFFLIGAQVMILLLWGLSPLLRGCLVEGTCLSLHESVTQDSWGLTLSLRNSGLLYLVIWCHGYFLLESKTVISWLYFIHTGLMQFQMDKSEVIVTVKVAWVKQVNRCKQHLTMHP